VSLNRVEIRERGAQNGRLACCGRYVVISLMIRHCKLSDFANKPGSE